MSNMNPVIMKVKDLPDSPGVYLFKNKAGQIIYIGKAGSLKRRVLSYFQRAGDIKTEGLVSEVFDLEFIKLPSALEALILEAELIKKYKPKYNIREKDDKSFIYFGITREDFSRPVLIRAHELAIYKKPLQAKFGPFTSATQLRVALKILRGIFPWSECRAGQGRPCFYYGIKKCPGACIGAISKTEYQKNIRNLILFFKGQKKEVIKNLEREMQESAKAQNFERALQLRQRIFALNHIRDIALIKKDEKVLHSRGVAGRIEGYDISNISGKLAVGSMVVFENGKPKKSEYRKFRIKTIQGANDTAMLAEVLERRFKNDWQKPGIIFVDGGEAQVNVAQKVLQKVCKAKPCIAVVGIAKGISRKNDRFVFDYTDSELKRLIKTHENLFKGIRDEAHRFALKYHRSLRKIK